MPKKIVVVDDEKLVVFGICSLLSEFTPGYEVAGTCCSGEDGLKTCMEHQPDLLLTDIGMPGMDGLKLIERVRRTNPSMKIAVLSCHDEYDLVHRAFMLGADDYILKKDIDGEKLRGLLERLLPETMEKSRINEKTGTITPLSDDLDFIPEAPGSLGIIGFKSEEAEELLWQPDIPMLHQLINDDLQPYGEFFLGLRNNLVIYFKNLNLKDQEKLESFLKKIRRSISKYINRTVFIAKYIMQPGESIIEAYNEGLKILDAMFYHTDSRILAKKTSLQKWDLPLNFEINRNGYRGQWLDVLENFLNESELKFISPESVKTELIYAIKHLLHNLVEIGALPSETEIPYYRKISDFDDLGRMKNWTAGFLSGIAYDLREGKQGGGIVGSVKLYVDGRLREDLKLNTISEALGVNPNHLSTVFRKTTGQTYIEYVNRKRIDHAIKLLETTDLSAKEIAYRCGYTNPNYFSRLFKKITKTTISEYRSGYDDNCE